MGEISKLGWLIGLVKHAIRVDSLYFFKKPENRTFRKLNLFPSSGEVGDLYFVGSLRKS
jgi:hypothetical protein